MMMVDGVVVDVEGSAVVAFALVATVFVDDMEVAFDVAAAVVVSVQ
jgi:hypothetical protein